MQLSACWALGLALVATTPVLAGRTVRNRPGTISTVLPTGWVQDAYLKKNHSPENLYFVSKTVGAITVYADCPPGDPFEFVQKYEGLYGEAHRLDSIEVADQTATRIEWRPLARVCIDLLVPFTEAPSGHCWIRFETRGDLTTAKVVQGKEALEVVLTSLQLRASKNRPESPSASNAQPRLFNDQKTLSVAAPQGWGEDISMRGNNTRVWRKIYLISADAKARITISPFYEPQTIPDYLESMKRWDKTPDSVEPTTALGRESTRICWNGHVYRSVEVFVPFQTSETGFYWFRLVSKEKADAAFSRYEPALKAVVESLEGTCDEPRHLQR